MSQENIFLFVIFCGLAGILLRRNFLNITVSLLQAVMGANALLGNFSAEDGSSFPIYLIFLLLFSLIIFMQSISILMIKRRSTLHVNELTELRG